MGQVVIRTKVKGRKKRPVVVGPGASENNTMRLFRYATFWLARSTPVFVNNSASTNGAVISTTGRAASSFKVFSFAVLSADRFRLSRFIFDLNIEVIIDAIIVEP